MKERFTIYQWIEEIKNRKTEMNGLITLLQKYNADTKPDEESLDVAALHYEIAFSFEENIVVTIGIILMDYQTDSDVVIETMSTFPKNKQRLGFGSKAVAKILQWALDNNLPKVRATQVKGKENENFWTKNGFVQQKQPNPCNDFIYHIPKKSA